MYSVRQLEVCISWPEPKFSKTKVNKAGDILISGTRKRLEVVEAQEIMNNWRSCHGYPINTFQKNLRDKLRSMHGDILVAQRLKRTPSILGKLQRIPKMRLARMQDIGGLRAVVSDYSDIERLVEGYKNSKFKHELIRESDYILNPKDSGYRSRHLIYRYKNPRAEAYAGLHIELQIRDQKQHAWATAVETVGTFLDESLKSSQGSKDWLEFFALTSSAIALTEGCVTVPKHREMSEDDVFRKTIEDSKKLKIKEHLQAFRVATTAITEKRSSAFHYHLVILDPGDRRVSVQGYGRNKLEEANNAYMEVEKKILEGSSVQAVLVSAGSVTSLKRAYPNLFLDTDEFLKILDEIEENIPQSI